MKQRINNLNSVIIALAAAVIFLLPGLAKASIADGVIDSVYRYAWGENTGWVNFTPTGGNIHITDSALTGYAWDRNFGWINLAPTQSGVKNDGRGNLSGSAWSQGGGYLNFSGVVINSSGRFTGTASGTIYGRLNFDCDQCNVATDYRPSAIRPACNNAIDDDGDGRIDFPTDFGCSGLTDESEVDVGAVIIVPPAGSPAGQQGSAPPPVTPTPEATPPAKAPTAESPASAAQPLTVKSASPLELVLNKLKEIFAPILSRLARLKPITSPEIALEKLVPREAPLALRGQWKIMPADSVNKFVFFPLPAELMKLAKKFPSLGKIFKEVSIFKITDISRLNDIALILPGLTETAGLPGAEIASGKFGFLQGLPLAGLTAAVKKSLPSEIVFAKAGLAVKQEIPVPVEEKLVLEEFDYADSDGDGLWTAEIKTPAVSGIYEIITVLYYKDPELGARAIKLTAVIDPEGYIFEKFQDKELRIPGAIVYLYWLNPEIKKYQAWPSEGYNQANPQVTDISGKYSFLVPPGSYYLRIEAPGYPIYEGKPFQVQAGGGVHANIELKAKYAWFKNFDWKTILLILVALFLAYNFYKDKLRVKSE